jgi:hypothetical protein
MALQHDVASGALLTNADLEEAFAGLDYLNNLLPPPFGDLVLDLLMQLKNTKKIFISKRPGMIPLSFHKQTRFGKMGLLIITMVMEKCMYQMTVQNYLLEKVGTKDLYQTMKLRNLEKSGATKEMMAKINQCFLDMNRQ